MDVLSMPPLADALLLEKVLVVIVRVPWLEMPPPEKLGCCRRSCYWSRSASRR